MKYRLIWGKPGSPLRKKHMRVCSDSESVQNLVWRDGKELISGGHTAFRPRADRHSPMFGHVNMATMRTALLVLFLSAFPIVASAEYSKKGQQPPTEFPDLSLEELMEVDVVPINILGTHTHLEGEWMLGYQFMFMNMDGSRDGTSRISDSDVLKDFKVTPTNMSMEMHMGMLMYAPSDDLTLMAMLPYTRLEMDHLTRTGVRFTTASEGIGDLEMTALYTFFRRDFDRHRLVLRAGLSVPTGSIDEKDRTPAGPNQQLPYPMQLGSGTFDLRPGITYFGETEDWAWAAEVDGTIRLGENSNDYTLGDRLHLSAMGTRRLTDWLAPFVRLDGQVWGNIDGADPALDPTLVPTADPDRRGGTRVDLTVGVNLYAGEGILKGHRLGIQGGLPIYQSLDGPQLETDWQVSIGWQWIFRL